MSGREKSRESRESWKKGRRGGESRELVLQHLSLTSRPLTGLASWEHIKAVKDAVKVHSLHPLGHHTQQNNQRFAGACDSKWQHSKPAGCQKLH